MDTKPWYQSRTVWTNVIIALITAAVAIAQAVSGKTIILDIGAQGVIVGLALAAINFGLRFVTKKPLA